VARPTEDELGHVRQLILIGKERGYLLYDEVNATFCLTFRSSQSKQSVWRSTCIIHMLRTFDAGLPFLTQGTGWRSQSLRGSWSTLYLYLPVRPRLQTRYF
jgi:hypothetical protein